MILRSVALVMLVILGISARPAHAALGDVVRTFSALNKKVWAGSVCWANGYLWETNRYKWQLFQRSQTSGEVLGSLWLPSPEVAGVTWNSKRGTWWITEPWDQYQVDDVLEVPEEGGDPIAGYGGMANGDSGIFYDAQLDRTWLTCNHAGKEYVGRLKNDGSMDWRVKLSERDRVVSVARAGNDLWIGDMAGPEGEEYGLICKYTLDGAETGVSFGLPGGRVPQSLSFDGRYLWVWACGYSQGVPNAVYQIDIEGEPGPEPTPPPLLKAEIIDYNGDGLSEWAVYRPSDGLWAISGVTRVRFGNSTDMPIPADYDRDGKANPAIFRPQNGLWRIHPRGKAYFGRTGDHPCPGDFNGDGKADAGIFRDDNGLWAVLNGTRLHFGQKGDMPIYADFDMDGVSDIGIFRPSTGLWAIRSITRAYLGEAGDYPVPGDYLGKGSQQIAVFRASQGLWAIRGGGRVTFGEGYGDYYPQPGDFTGNGRHNITGFWNESVGAWVIYNSRSALFGGKGDIPVSSRIYRTY
jgi:hypothetical protein